MSITQDLEFSEDSLQFQVFVNLDEDDEFDSSDDPRSALCQNSMSGTDTCENSLADHL